MNMKDHIEWFLIQNLHMDLSFQEKKLLENLMIGCRDVCKVNTEQVIFKYPGDSKKI